MNKADLISIVEPRVGSRKVATDVVESIFDAVIREVADARVLEVAERVVRDEIDRVKAQA